MSSQFSGKTALVTGSTSGIGLAIAVAFAQQGANVALNSFTNGEEDRALAAGLAEDHGVKCVYLGADMVDGDAARKLVANCMSEFGSVDILVNNAGVQHMAAIDNFPVDQWNRIIAINLNSAFHTIAAAIPLMKKAGAGRIINIASAHGLVASPFKSAYIAAKHGLVGMTKSVALEVAENGITCNAVCPGFVLTPLVEAQIPDQMALNKMNRETVEREIILARQPTRRFVTVEEIAAACTFLASEGAASITGTTLSVDGGWTAM
nr:3-hydroxybutyrate dehydrogenase [Limoniibacter endophyticus]